MVHYQLPLPNSGWWLHFAGAEQVDSHKTMRCNNYVCTLDSCPRQCFWRQLTWKTLIADGF